MIKKSSTSSSPTAGTSSKSSPIENLRKVSSSNGGRNILPKTITASQSCSDKKPTTTIITNVNYSSQKCQNDAKQHPSYSVFHSKPIAKPTSIQQQQQQSTVQPRQINGSYARLTNKLNCCKSCIREPDDAIGKKCSNEVSIAKLKNDTKYQSQSQFIESNINYEQEQQQPKYKLPSEARRSTIPGALRRSSIDPNVILRKSTFKRSLDEDLLNAGDFRRQSFDECPVKATTNQRILKKLTPQSEHQSDFHRNGNGNYLSQPVSKHIIDNRPLIKQKSLDEYSDATARLRKLELKMRKHKIDVLKYANDHDQSPIYSDPKKLLAYPSANHFRTKLDPFARTRADCVYPKIGIDSMLQSKNASYRRNGSNGGSYGIITSSELYKLRGTAERVT